MGKYYRKKQKSILLYAIVEAIYKIVTFTLHLVFYIIPKLIYFIWSIWGYRKSEYYAVTHKSLPSMLFDKGARGEYLIYRHLSKLPGNKKWLFNIYLPRENTRTTEVDVILIHESGIYVFESKNYNGWIFGTENRKVWTQCLKPSEKVRTRKYQFLNPIMQNKLHLKYLHKYIPEIQKQNIPVYSIVLFGMRCKLKRIELISNEHLVITLKELRVNINNLSSNKNMLNENDISFIYQRLYPLTQVSEETKQKHIADINNEIKSESSEQNYVQESMNL